MTNKSNNTIGKRIVNRRLELGLTQSKLAEKCQISIPTLSNIEGDNRTPSMDTIMVLAPALNCSIDYILLGNDGTPPVPIKNISKEEKILSSIATLIEFNVLYPRGQKEWDEKFSYDSYLDFTSCAKKEILLEFSDQIEKLVSLKLNTKKMNNHFDELIKDLIENYIELLK